MNKEELDFLNKYFDCVPNGSKEACIKVREYLQHIDQIENGITVFPSCVVSNQQFLNSVRILLAYAWQNKENDCAPEFWYCDNDCSYLDGYFLCPGEFQLAAKEKEGKNLSKKRCPYFTDSIYK